MGDESKYKKGLKKMVNDKIILLGGKRPRKYREFKFVREKERKPIIEIYYDWETVLGFAYQASLSLEDKYEGEKDTLEYKNRFGILATINAYLELARYEKDLGEAWNHVNSADKLLPLVVDNASFVRCTARLQGWDQRLIELYPNVEKKLEELDTGYYTSMHLRKWDEDIPPELTEVLDTMLRKINIMAQVHEIIHDPFKGELDDLKKKLKESLNSKKMLNLISEDKQKSLEKKVIDKFDNIYESLPKKMGIGISSRPISADFCNIVESSSKKIDGLYKNEEQSKIWNDQKMIDLNEIIQETNNEINRLFNNSWELDDEDTKLQKLIKKILNNIPVWIKDIFDKEKIPDIVETEFREDFEPLVLDARKKCIDILKTKWKWKINDESNLNDLNGIFERTKNMITSIYKEEMNVRASQGSQSKKQIDKDGHLVQLGDWRKDLEYRKQANRAQFWYSINMRHTLTNKIWRDYLYGCVVTIAAIIVIGEAIHCGLYPDRYILYRPFVIVAIFGFIGGYVSSSVMARNLVENNASRQLSRILLLNRMFFGALGALIVYLLFGSGLIESDLSQSMSDNILVLICVAILSGFTEQIGVTALDKSAKNLDIFGG